MRIKRSAHPAYLHDLYTNRGTAFDDWIMQVNLSFYATEKKGYLRISNFRFKI